MTCSFEKCERSVWSRGLCNAHYLQRHSGKELRPIGQKRKKAIRPLIPHPTDPSLVLVPLTRGYFATISAVDSERVGRYNWQARIEPNTVYATGHGDISRLHRLIGGLMGLSVDNEIDHRNGNGLDCRRSNLRDATRAQNSLNKGMSSRNRSGIKGVHWDKQTSRWAASIGINGKGVRLGRFDSIEDAAAAYKEASLRLHGEFSSIMSRSPPS